jgi:hypothetical protein
VFEIGDLVKIVLYDHMEQKGQIGLIVEIDYNTKLHSFPMYIVMMLESGDRKFMYPDDIEGVSLVNRKRTSSVYDKDTI